MLYNYINRYNQKTYVCVDENGNWIESIKSYLDFCKDIRCLEHNTINAYCIELNRFTEWLKEQKIELTSVDLDTVIKYRNSIEKDKKLSISTVNRSMSIISGYLNYIYIFKYNMDSNLSVGSKVAGRQIRINNCNKLNGIVESKKEFTSLLRKKENHREEKEVLTLDEINMLIDACSNDRDRLIISILLETGIRIGELISLTIDSIDIDKSQIVIRDVELEEGNYKLKTRAAAREIEISINLLNRIIDYIVYNSREIDSNFIFTKLSGDCKGEQIDYYVIDSMFKRLRQKTKIHRLHPHLIRVTSLTRSKDYGMSKEILHRRAGHKSWTTTNKYYTKPSLEQRAHALDVVETIGLIHEYRNRNL